MRPPATASAHPLRTAILVVMSLLLAMPASGHGIKLLRSEPASGERREGAPARVRAWYGEELDVRRSSIRVFDKAGQRVDAGDGRVDLSDLDRTSMTVRLGTTLALGRYVVHWTAVSAADGDKSEGEFSFSVGR